MRTKILAVAVTLASLVVVPVTAFAGPKDGPPAKVQHDGREGKERPKFPMPAAEFKAKVDGRIAKARQRMEERAGKLDAAEAKALRAKFDAGVAKVNQEVSKATADGTVTKDEAKAVRQVAKEVAPGHHGKHARHGKRGKRGGGKK
jgi:hypothetical protein